MDSAVWDAFRVRFRATFSGSTKAMAAFMVEGCGGVDKVPEYLEEDWGFFVLENFAPYPPFDRDHAVDRYGRFCAQVFASDPTAALALDPDPVFRAVLGAEFAVLNGIDLDLEAIERVRAHTRPAGIASRPQ